jgi:excisionase family DNA binding protein
MENYISTIFLKYGRKLLKKSEVASELGVSVQTVDRLRKSYDLQSKKVGGQIRFDIQELARYMEAS